MPAKSKSQQRFFGIIRHCKKSKEETGICNSPKIKKVIDSISDEDADDFASTKHKGLPEKVESARRFTSFKNWLEAKGENIMSKCTCDCESCKHGDCSSCTCKNCKCEHCTCN